MAEPQQLSSSAGEETPAPANSVDPSTGRGEQETLAPTKSSVEAVVAGGEENVLIPRKSSVVIVVAGGEENVLIPAKSSAEKKSGDEGQLVAPVKKETRGEGESLAPANSSVEVKAGGEGETIALATSSTQTKAGGEGETIAQRTITVEAKAGGEDIIAPATSSVETAAAGGGGTFSQLLSGAMGTGASKGGCGAAAAVPILAMPVDSSARLPVVAVPCIIAPAALIESPGFAGPFAMTHQAVLATVTAQAQLQLQLHASHASPSSELTISSPKPSASTVTPCPIQHIPPTTHEDHSCMPDAELSPSSRQKSNSARIILRENSNDGYSWRKYGQKQVKSSDSSRSYYRCANANCSVKKKVQHFQDGRVIEIVYKGSHNHEPPQKTRVSRERKSPPSGLPLQNDEMELSSRISNELDDRQSKLEENHGNASPQQLHCSSDCEEDAGVKNEDHCDEQDSKRRLIENPTAISAQPLRIVRESKIVVQAAINSSLASDGYKWRKYGQKFVKGNPNPRSYYRCTQYGCPVRKHVERSCDDAKSFIITYEGKHNHEQPLPRNGPDPVSDEAPTTRSAAPALMICAGPQKEDEIISHKKPKSENLDGEDTQKDDQKSRIISEKTTDTTQTQPGIEEVGNAASSQQPVLSANHAKISVKNS